MTKSESESSGIVPNSNSPKSLSNFLCVAYNMNYFECIFCSLVECSIVYVRKLFQNLKFWKYDFLNLQNKRLC